MKLYKNLVNAVALTLQETFSNNRYADRALEKIFKQNPQWGSRDRRFVAEAVYDIVRYYRLYSELAESKSNFWFITAVWLVIKGIDIPDWPEFKHVDAPSILKKKQWLVKDIVISESYPDWLWQLGEKELGAENWLKEAVAMNKQAGVFIRANSIKSEVQKLGQLLSQDGVLTEPVKAVPGALMLLKRENVFQNKYFREGLFEVQDAGSQLIGLFVAPKPGQFIIDACAGAGGKSLQMAALMQNKGKLVSMDVESWKLEELKKRAKRAGIQNIETYCIDNESVIQKFVSKADKLLLDVPCSGLGVLKRNPDAKWKLSPETISRTLQLQAKILNAYSIMVKPGGELIYATCSLLPSENQKQVADFLTNNTAYRLTEDRMIMPSEGFDGFYMARLTRT